MPQKHTPSPKMSRSGSSKTPEVDAMFVGWTPGAEKDVRKTAPRLHHKKSRTGCQQCRARRVKCNEVHPTCGSCARHKTTCVWGRQGTPAQSQNTKPKTYEIRPKVHSQREPESTESDEPSECSQRRLTELRLLHQYMAFTCMTLNFPDDHRQQHEWGIAIPHLAFQHNSLLYSIYTLAALHIAKLEPNDPSHISTYQKYLGLTLRSHRDEVGQLSRSNADAACITSSCLRVCTFALLQERPLTPYTPPTEWLQMSSTTGRGLNVEAWKYIANDPNSIMRSMIRSAPGMKPGGFLREETSVFHPSNRQDLLHLLRRTPNDILTEPWNARIEEAYESTLSYIGSVQLAIAAQEPPASIFRRLVLFPTMVQSEFIFLVKEQRPRALVVLAHFFAFLADFRDIWWIGETGVREVRGIEGVVGEEWRGLMGWPVQAVEDSFFLECLDLSC
ncbi:hypothetical protein ONS96_010739 [Cadophora gregata f. sp. sojae]|nr:hypothetical protein ONS96_010739 [Cadophora gregata f. sp. sojae]